MRKAREKCKNHPVKVVCVNPWAAGMHPRRWKFGYITEMLYICGMKQQLIPCGYEME